jgi:N6-adenosine-specific RNA methylase IME4
VNFAGLGKFGVILADPPWDYRDKGHDRRIDRQYSVMTLDEICALPVQSIAERDCVLFLWVPGPLLFEVGPPVMKAWGFTYKENVAWDKEIAGMGHYFRMRHELLLFGRRGDPPEVAKPDRPPSVLEARRKGHSEKPPETYGMIERMYRGLSKVELFARRRRLGWTPWGDDPALADLMLPLETPEPLHNRVTERSDSDECNSPRLHKAIALLEQALEEGDATKPCWKNRNRLLDAIALLERCF